MKKEDKIVLYVDDEVENLQVFKIMLRKNYTVLTSNSADEALETLKKEDVKVLIADQRMPGMTGLELISSVKLDYPDIICIILTAFADVEVLMQALNQGGIYRYILKPWEESDLKLTLNNAFERYRIVKENRDLQEDLGSKNQELQTSNKELQATTQALEARETSLQKKNEEFLLLNEELKKTVDQLKLSKEKAEESDRLKSAFLANMSHEIRTPMNGIMGFAELLTVTDRNSEKFDMYIDIIRSSGERMLNLINDLIDISKIEAGITRVFLKDFNLTSLMNDVFEFFKYEADEKSIHLTLEKPEDDEFYINSDQAKIGQILNNFIKNAIKFTNEGEIMFGYIKKNNFIEFFVQDTGIGISSEYHEQIFERFRQAEGGILKQTEGAGLGLSIAKSFIEMLGGKIWFNSIVNSGTTFYFSIPLVEAKISQKKTRVKADKMNMKLKKEGLNLMIVEDDATNSEYLQQLLTTLNAHVIMAGDGLEAIEKADSQRDIEMILMDIKMPRMDGYETARVIRNKYPHIPIIAQTAYAMTDELEKIHDSCFDGYIIKPITISNLITTINNTLEDFSRRITGNIEL